MTDPTASQPCSAASPQDEMDRPVHEAGSHQRQEDGWGGAQHPEACNRKERRREHEHDIHFEAFRGAWTFALFSGNSTVDSLVPVPRLLP